MQPAVYHLVRRDSSAIKFDRVEIAFILALFYWLKPLTDEDAEKIIQGAEKTGVPGEPPPPPPPSLPPPEPRKHRKGQCILHRFVVVVVVVVVVVAFCGN